MSNIVSLTPASTHLINVKDMSVMENIQANFDCHTREGAGEELILDMVFLDSDETGSMTAQLLDILGVKPGSDEAELIARGTQYLVFYY